jgi:hypothetical protein
MDLASAELMTSFVQLSIGTSVRGWAATLGARCARIVDGSEVRSLLLAAATHLAMT